MKALIFANSTEQRSSAPKIAELKKNLTANGIQIELIDSNSTDGSQRASNYDIMSYPALALVREDGAVQGVWQVDLPDYASISQSSGHI